MLRELTVRNFAVIEETRLALAPGFNAITGETGAGKSLLVDAMELVLGGRADRGVVRAGASSAYVEAVFEPPADHPVWREAIENLGLSPEEDGLLVLAREAFREGRTLCRINGRTVPLSAVRAVGQHLVDIHGQGDHLSLLNPSFQLQILDGYGGLEEDRRAVSELAARLRRQERELTALTNESRQRGQRRELLAFQVEEIDAASLRPEEARDLAQEREILGHARAIREACAAAHEALYAASPSATELIAQARQALDRTSSYASQLGKYSSALESALSHIEEAARGIRVYADSVEDDPVRLQQVEERLELLRTLERKYGEDLGAVLAYAEKASRELDTLEHAGERHHELEREVAEVRATLGTRAWDLSSHRRQAAAALERVVAAELGGMGMGHVHFEVSLGQQKADDGLPSPQGGPYAFNESGIDQAEFLVATNPGEGLRPLGRVASGGETSRLMLAVKGALQAHDRVPTLVFDEIDSGVGGRSGEVIGQKLWSLAQRGQVLCVTHLPQIAAYADHHFRVDKEVLLGRTFAQAVFLEGRERVQELATLLGTPITPQMEGAARQILDRAQAHKRQPSPAARQRTRAWPR